jgi:putative heme-binding domain-containing protein
LWNEDEDARQIAAHCVSLWRDREAFADLLAVLRQVLPAEPWSQNDRAVVEALGRIEDKRAVPALLDAASKLRSSPDRMFEHSLIFALIEIADPQQTAEGLKSKNAAVRRAALIALDQMPGGGLKPQMVAELLGSKEPLIKETAAWIVGRHADWGDALAGYLRARLTTKDMNEADAAELQRLLSQFAKAAQVQVLMAQALCDRKIAIAARRIVLRAMAVSGVKEPPESWTDALTELLGSKEADLLEPSVAAARALPAAKTVDLDFAEALLGVAGRVEAGANIRIGAAAAVPGGLVEVSPEFFGFLRANLDPERDVLLRSSAADVLAKAKLSPEQLAALTESFKIAGPLEADRLLPAFKECADMEIGSKLIAALKESPALSGLRIDSLKTNLAKFPESVQTQIEELYGLINVDAAKQKEKLDALLSSLKNGDIRRGQAVFNGSKAACAACHPFGYLGGNVGPDLTRIGQIRSERDLLEAIVFPSVSFVRSFEPVVILTRDGKSINGLVKKESADEIVLATGPREEARIARDEIEEMRPSSVSVMPSGLDQQLSPQDLADLVAFLKNAK